MGENMAAEESGRKMESKMEERGMPGRSEVKPRYQENKLRARWR
jgi:hypothetical protein